MSGWGPNIEGMLPAFGWVCWSNLAKLGQQKPKYCRTRPTFVGQLSSNSWNLGGRCVQILPNCSEEQRSIGLGVFSERLSQGQCEGSPFERCSHISLPHPPPSPRASGATHVLKLGVHRLGLHLPTAMQVLLRMCFDVRTFKPHDRPIWPVPMSGEQPKRNARTACV